MVIKFIHKDSQIKFDLRHIIVSFLETKDPPFYAPRTGYNTIVSSDDIYNGKLHCDMGHPMLIFDILKEIGANVNEEFESNGWQYDWYTDFEYQGRNYHINGSGYYGGFTIGEI